MCSGWLTPFPNQHSLFCYPFFFNEYFNIQVIISKMTNERSVKRLSSSHIFPYFRRLSCLSTLLLNFLWNLYIPLSFGEMFKTMVFALLENTFFCKKIESRHFYSFSHPCQVKHSPLVLVICSRQRFFKNLFTTAVEVEGNMIPNPFPKAMLQALTS